MIDTHSHLTDGRLLENLEHYLTLANQAGVDKIITVGTDYADSQAAFELAQKYHHIFCAVGVHPHQAKDLLGNHWIELEQLANKNKVVAIGEMGLDYHYEFSARAIQKKVFADQLQLARKVDLPAIIHCREAFEDCIAIIDENRDENKMVFHCFSGDKTMARAVLDRNGWISLAGTVTFKNADELKEVASYIPIEKMMIETDCPYLSPMPKRNEKPNHPALIVHTARYIAELRKMPIEDFSEAMTQNTQEFFRLN